MKKISDLMPTLCSYVQVKSYLIGIELYCVCTNYLVSI